jgi:hypothetical protein
MTNTWEIGPHHLRFEPPILYVDMDAVVSEDEAHAVLRVLVELDQLSGELALLVTTGPNFSITAAARRVLVKSNAGQRPGLPMAVIGSGPLVRTLMTLLINAVRLTSRTAIPVAFFSSAAEAQPWLTAQIPRRLELLRSWPR